MMAGTIVPPKISLFKYATGQLDIQAIRTSMGLSPYPSRKHRNPGYPTDRVLMPKTHRISYGVIPPPPPTNGKELITANEATKLRAAAAGPNGDNAFSAAEDARIVEWKAANEGKAWKILAEELGRSESALKARFKELKGTAEKPQGQAKEAEHGAVNTGKKPGQDIAKGKFDARDDELVRKLLKWDDEDKWLRIASRFFDQTGQNVHPDDLKDTFGSK